MFLSCLLTHPSIFKPFWPDYIVLRPDPRVACTVNCVSILMFHSVFYRNKNVGVFKIDLGSRAKNQ